MMHVDLKKKDIKKFFVNYDVGYVLSYKRIKKGFANVVVVVKTTRGKYILKIVVRNNPFSRVRYEVDLLNFIKGLPTPNPVKAKNKQYLLDYNKTNKAFIYPYLPGRQLKKIDKSMLKQVGEFLGKLHLRTKNFKSSVRRMELYNIDQKYFREMIKVSRKSLKDKKIQKWIDYMGKNLMQYLLPKSLPQGGMHIDYKPENVLFTKDKITGIIDFDNSYNGPLVLDLANTMMWFCSEEGKFDVKNAFAIYQGYRSIRKLNSQEKEYLFEALHFAFLSHMLVDIYFLALDKLPLSYIKWGMANLCETEKNLTLTKEEFKSIFN